MIPRDRLDELITKALQERVAEAEPPAMGCQVLLARICQAEQRTSAASGTRPARPAYYSFHPWLRLEPDIYSRSQFSMTISNLTSPMQMLMR